MIVLIFGAPGIGKTVLLRALGERLGCPYLEMSWMPEFRVMNGRQISYEEDELIAVDTLLVVARSLLRHGHRAVLLSDFRMEVVPAILSVTTPAERIVVKLVMHDDVELKCRVLDPSRTSDYRRWDEAVQINQRLSMGSLADDEMAIDVTGMPIADEVDLLSGIIRDRLGTA